MSTSELTLPPPVGAPVRRRWPVVLGVLLAVILVAVIVSAVVSAPYYELVPGQAMSVSELITVPPEHAHKPTGKVLLTDVGVNTMKYITFIPAWLDSNAEVVPSDQLTADLPVSEFDAQGTVDMSESQLTAEAVALRQLGYEVPEHDAGVTVYVIDPTSPAWKALHVGDVITAIDGVATPNPDALQSVLRRHQPGETITLRVGSITAPAPGHDVPLKLASIREDNGTVEPFIGIGIPHPRFVIPPMGTQPVYDLPFKVDISSDNIGGPSAGLAFTLGIINSLSGGHLTGGKVVAATGTIRPDGSVGDVGGVAQKTVAVERAGATLFLVPPEELKVARSKATPSLTVKAVSTLAQAMADLEQIGGRLGPAANGPPMGDGGHSVPYDWQNAPWT